MAEVNRVKATDIRAGVVEGTILLVCAYEDDSKFLKYQLDGAIPLSEFKTRLVDLPKAKKIVFYCA